MNQSKQSNGKEDLHLLVLKLICARTERREYVFIRLVTVCVLSWSTVIYMDEIQMLVVLPTQNVSE
jgi:hypothetical protein